MINKFVYLMSPYENTATALMTDDESKSQELAKKPAKRAYKKRILETAEQPFETPETAAQSEEQSLSTEPTAAAPASAGLTQNQLLINLSYTLMAQIKQLARSEGVTTEDIVVELLSDGMARRSMLDANRPGPSHLMTRTGYVPPDANGNGYAAQPNMSHHNNDMWRQQGNQQGNGNGNHRRYSNGGGYSHNPNNRMGGHPGNRNPNNRHAPTHQQGGQNSSNPNSQQHNFRNKPKNENR